MSTVLRVSPSWRGFDRVKHMVIFGDSYSSVMSREEVESQGAAPTPLLPLGVPYPGTAEGIWNEPDLPNWVGHLLTKYRSGPRFNPEADEQDAEWFNKPLLVYDHAVDGAEVWEVELAIDHFLELRAHPSLIAPEESLFVVWVGINDCADTGPKGETVRVLFRTVNRLYNGGARNFMFFDVPPIHRSPAYPRSSESWASVSYHTWNDCLKTTARDFATAHPEATVMICSSNAVFDAILDFPEDYGFLETETRLSNGTVWYDHLHPTSAVHEQIAAHIGDFLASVPVCTTHSS